MPVSTARHKADGLKQPIFETGPAGRHLQQIPEEGGFEVFWVDGRGAQAQGWYWQIFAQHGLSQAWMHGPFATAKRAYNAARGLWNNTERVGKRGMFADNDNSKTGLRRRISRLSRKDNTDDLKKIAHYLVEIDKLLMATI